MTSGDTQSNQQNPSSVDKSQMYMRVAREISKFSKCVSIQVGCIAVKDGRILGTGYNGTPQGYINCNDKFSDGWTREEHHAWSSCYEIHAEMNLILFCCRNMVSLEGADIYVTVHPCHECIKNIIQSGVKRIFYNVEYDLMDTEQSDKFLKDNSISIHKVDL